MPALRAVVEELTGWPPRAGIDADHLVAVGAAAEAALHSGITAAAGRRSVDVLLDGGADTAAGGALVLAAAA